MDIDKVRLLQMCVETPFVNKKVVQWWSIHEASQLNAIECDDHSD